MRPFFTSVVLFQIGLAEAIAQSTPATNGLDLLKHAAQHYADTKSYYIESVEERTTSGAYSRFRTRTVLIAAEEPGNRFHFEAHSDNGNAMKVADGKTVWKYRADEHRYTAKPAGDTNERKPEPIAMPEIGVLDAGNLRKQLAAFARPFKSAQRLPDAMLTVNGTATMCHVVRVRDIDQKRIQADYVFERTFWIDSKHNIVLKVIEHAHNVMISGSARLPITVDSTTKYANTMLDEPVRESLFTFSPPTGARLIQDFPDPADEGFGNSMAGDPIPPLKLKSPDGKIVPIESFRGKPVLLDFWATWCAPCVASLPYLAQIYQEGKDKGLVLLSIDQDEDGSTAANFLHKRNYTWPDFHDGDGAIEKLMGPSGIPRIVLADAQGQIVYDGGASEDALRNHIAKLGPEFKELAPKPKPAPCVAAK